MQDFLSKAKKFGAALVVIVIVVVLGSIMLVGLGPTRKMSRGPYDNSGGLPAAPLTSLSGAPSFSLSNPFAARESAPQNIVSQAKAQPFAEGDLTKRKVVRNGSLSLLVNKAEDVAKSIQSIAEGLGGFVQDSQIYEVSAGVKSGTVTVRVPAEKFTEAFAAIKNLAVKVDRESINAQDVTEQFVDLDAQLRNLRSEETQLQGIMQKANTVQDTLSVASQLSSVRGSIERIQGQLQYLSRQVDMSSIAVTLTAEADVEVFGIRWRPLFIMKQAFRDLLTGLTGYIDWMIGFLFNLPVYLLWIVTIGAIVIAAWKIFRWVKRRFFATAF